MNRLSARAILLMAAVLLWTPFVGRALFVDDHAHFQEALDLKTHWASPYNTDGRLGWPRGGPPSEANPPLYFYLIAFLTLLVGESTWAVHLGLWPLHAAGLLAFYALAKRWTKHPLWAALAWLATPHHWLTVNSLLLDALIAPLGLIGLAFWIRGWEEDRAGFLTAGALVLGLAPCVKYTGVLFIGVAVLWTWMWGEARTRRIPFFLLTGAPLAVWALWSRHLYGAVHMTAVAGGVMAAPSLAAIGTILLFVLGTTPVLWAAAPAVWGRRWNRIDVFLGLWAVAAVAGLWTARGWICGRFLVVAGPALVLVAARLLEEKAFFARAAVRQGLLAALTGVGGLLAVADMAQAGADRDAAARLNSWATANLAAGEKAYFPEATLSGLEFYLDDRWATLRPGEQAPLGSVVVVPLRGLPAAFRPGFTAPVEIQRWDARGMVPVRVQDPPTGAGYYGSIWGHKPWAWGRQPLETYVLLKDGVPPPATAGTAPKGPSKK